MFEFFRCVAEAVVASGARGLLEVVPGGGFVFDVASESFKRLRERRQEVQLRADLEQLAQASVAEARPVAEQVAHEVPGVPPECLPSLVLFLTQIPAAVRQSQKRPDDPTGTTLAHNFVLRSPDDMAKLLPPRPPRFAPGETPATLRGWILEELLGVGGFGEVWKVRHATFDNLRAAVKFAHALTERERQLLHEGRVINRVMAEGRHPGIVPLLDASLDESEAPWLRYEYVAGGDLTDQVRLWQKLPPRERLPQAAACLRELAATIGHFHRLDPPIVHRDLKPANILCDRTARNQGSLGFVPRVVDFGIGGVAASRLLTGEAHGTTTRAGRLLSYLRGAYTPLYASPQQRDGGEPDPRDDVHALGVIGYQMITGHLNLGAGPDFAEDLAELGASGELIGILNRCVAQRAERRWKDALELAERLSEVLDSAAPVGATHTYGPARQEPRPPSARQSSKSPPFASPSQVVEHEEPTIWSADFPLAGPAKQESFADVMEDFRAYVAALKRGQMEALMRRIAPGRINRWREAMMACLPDAQALLGVCFDWGFIVSQIPSEAHRLFVEAANAGSVAAMYNLGNQYRDGRAVPQDHARAIEWYSRAADRGFATAQTNLGCLYRDAQGVPQAYGKALQLFLKAADQNDAIAQTSIGWMYRNGLGVPHSPAKAAEWYRKAANQGYAVAQNNLGWMYQKGLGVPQDHARAIELYEQAAEQGLASAQVNLGSMYRDGVGIPVNHVKALEWYRKAADQGDASGQASVAWMYRNGLGVPVDHGKALQWYHKAAEQGDAIAQNNLGWMWEKGLGVPANLEKAIEWYRKAADKGEAAARGNLQRLGRR